MRTTTAAIGAVLLLAALTACSSSDGREPAKVTATVTKTPELSAEEARAACVEAWADTISARPSDWDSEVDSDPEPEACKGLPEGDYTDRYFEGLQQSNKEARDKLGECLDDPACTSFPLEP